MQMQIAFALLFVLVGTVLPSRPAGAIVVNHLNTNGCLASVHVGATQWGSLPHIGQTEAKAQQPCVKTVARVYVWYFGSSTYTQSNPVSGMLVTESLPDVEGRYGRGLEASEGATVPTSARLSRSRGVMKPSVSVVR